MAFSRVVSLGLRASEVVCAAIVAGITGFYLARFHSFSSWTLGRFIYVEVLAGVSMLVALLWLIPFSWSLTHWPVDVVLSIGWWIAFALLINWGHAGCVRPAGWHGLSPWRSSCARYRTGEAFAFLSAILWLVSALVGHFWVRRHERATTTTTAATEEAGAVPPRRRGLFRRSYV